MPVPGLGVDTGVTRAPGVTVPVLGLGVVDRVSATVHDTTSKKRGLISVERQDRTRQWQSTARTAILGLCSS